MAIVFDDCRPEDVRIPVKRIEEAGLAEASEVPIGRANRNTDLCSGFFHCPFGFLEAI